MSPRRRNPPNLFPLVAQYMHARGWVGDDVERRQGPIRRDFLGFGDSVWLHSVDIQGEKRCLIVQHTSRPHLSDRARKVQGRPGARVWLRQGGEIWVMGIYDRDGVVRYEIEEVVLGGRGMRESVHIQGTGCGRP